jgi:hypothetical protein
MQVAGHEGTTIFLCESSAVVQVGIEYVCAFHCLFADPLVQVARHEGMENLCEGSAMNASWE